MDALADTPPAALWPTLKRVFGLGRGHRAAIAAMIAAMIFIAGINFALMLAFESIVTFFGASGLASPTQDSEAARIIADLQDTLWWVVPLAPLAGLAAFASWYLSQYVANRCMQDLRLATIRHLIALDLGFHSRLATGDLIARMSGDTERTQQLLSSLYGKVMQRPAEVLGVVGAMFWLEWRLSLLIFGGFLPLLLLLGQVFKRVRKRSRRARESMAGLMVVFEQIASGIRVIQAMGSAPREAERFAGQNQRLFDANMRVARSRAQADGITYGILPLVMAALIALGPVLCRSFMMAPSVLAVFLACLMRMMQLLRTAQREWTGVVEGSPCAGRVFAILDRQPAIQDAPDARPCPPPREQLRLSGVRFRYDHDSEPVLNACDLTIPMGGTIALVGESGVGKSTILDLLPRLYDVEAGAVELDGVDIRAYELASLRQHFAIVQQDSFLFNDTIYANIAYGRPDATQADIETAARRAHVHEAICQLEGGLAYATPVGERGGRLSGGQRQRIAIARAFLRNAPILLLDEPTSALDAESEGHVQAALQELLQGRTAIIVAHRLSTIKNADCIHVIDKTRKGVIESGRHDELIAAGGAYARLVAQQRL